MPQDAQVVVFDGDVRMADKPTAPLYRIDGQRVVELAGSNYICQPTYPDEIVFDFIEWSGGRWPDECEPGQVERYIQSNVTDADTADRLRKMQRGE
jgi:hypothetical protein